MKIHLQMRMADNVRSMEEKTYLNLCDTVGHKLGFRDLTSITPVFASILQWLLT